MNAVWGIDQQGWGIVASVVLGIALVLGRRFTPLPWRNWLAPAYWIGIPYLALILGAVSPRLMGLYWLDWNAAFQVGAGLLLAVLALAAAARLLAGGGGAPATGSTSQPMLLFALAGAEEFFWCYLRAALWEGALGLATLPAAPSYVAVWAAGLIALPVSLALQPGWTARLTKMAIWLVTSVVFLYTRNFWLCWAVHGALAVVLVPGLGRMGQAKAQ